MSNEASNYIELRKVRDFSEVISTGFQFIRQNWKALYRPLLFYYLPPYVAASFFLGRFLRNVGMSTATGSTAGLVSGMGSMLFGYLLMVLASVLMYAIVYEFMAFYLMNRGLVPGAGEVGRRALRRSPSYLAVIIVAGIITSIGLVLFILPGIWLAVLFSLALPVLAFGSGDIGDGISRPFKLVRGQWWVTFGLIVVLAMLITFISYIIYLPLMLLTGFGAMSGATGMEDPESLGWLMSLFMMGAGVVNMLLQPFLLVPIGFHALSLMEAQEGQGLMERVDAVTGTGQPQ